jgi:hypothetical protein
MEKKSSRLQHREQEELAQQQQTTQQSVREFATAEELLRHDATQTSVPPAVVERLQESIEREPKLASSWWRRLFSPGP